MTPCSLADSDNGVSNSASPTPNLNPDGCKFYIYYLYL
jgi:hypothetical protein